MAVGEGGERLGRVEAAGGDVVVEGFEGLLEGVVVALVVAAGIADVGAAASETRPGSRISCWLACCDGRSRVRWAARCSKRRWLGCRRSHNADSSCGRRLFAIPTASRGRRRKSGEARRRCPRSRWRSTRWPRSPAPWLKGLDFTGRPLAGGVNGLQVGLHGADERPVMN